MYDIENERVVFKECGGLLNIGNVPGNSENTGSISNLLPLSIKNIITLNISTGGGDYCSWCCPIISKSTTTGLINYWVHNYGGNIAKNMIIRWEVKGY